MTLDALGSWVGTACLLSAVPLAGGWLATSRFSRQRASVRHHLWVIALATAMLAPLVRFAAPPIEIPLWPGTSIAGPIASPESDSGTALPALQSSGRAVAARDNGSRGDRLPPAGEGRARFAFSYAAVLAIVWLIGTVWLSAIRIVRRVRLARIVAKGRRLDALELSAGILAHESVVVPMLAGLRRPIILLPPAAAGWPVGELEAVLAHERAHLARRDHLMALLCDLAIAIYWINPLVWLATSALEREREQACDEEVMHMGVKPSVYAAALLRVAQGLSLRTGIGGAPAMAGGRLDDRVRAVLATGTPRGGGVPMSWRATIALLVPCAVIVGSVHLVAQTPPARPLPDPPGRPIGLTPPPPGTDLPVPRQSSETLIRIGPDGNLESITADEIRVEHTAAQQPAPDKAARPLVTVFGEVRNPGRYPLNESKSALEALAEAGGTTSAAGGEAEILGANGERTVIDLVDSRALHAHKLRPGDVVTVAKARVFYIAGQVRNPGAYVWQRGRTLAQAVTLAGGLADLGTYRDALATRLQDGRTVDVLLGENGLIQPDDQIKISSVR